MRRLVLIGVVVLGVPLTPTAVASPTRFELFGIVCETRGRTVLTGTVATVERDPDPDIEFPSAMVPPLCKGKLQVSGFPWSKIYPSDLWNAKRGMRSTVFARITGTVIGKTFRVSGLKTTDLTSVRFDGYRLSRPAIFYSAFIARSWPSSCNFGDSRALSQQLPAQLQPSLDGALQDDPDLRVRTLVNGQQEIVTYKPLSDPVRSLSQAIGASVCVETETPPVPTDQVSAFIESQKVTATVTNATLPSGRVVVPVSGDWITLEQKTKIMEKFGSRVAIDSAIRT